MAVTPGVLVVVLAAAAAAAFVLRDRWPWPAIVGLAGLGAGIVLAAALDPAASSSVLGLTLSASPFARLTITAAVASIAGVALVGEFLRERPPAVHAGLLAGVTGVALALLTAVTAPGGEGDPGATSLGGPAAAVFVVAATTALLVPLAVQSRDDRGASGWLRIATIGAALAAVGIYWPPLPVGGAPEPGPPDTSGAVIALMLVAGGLGLRAGAVPIQGPVAGLVARSRLQAVALSGIWLPVVMALAVVSWSAAVLGPLSGLVPPDGRHVAALFGVLTLLAGGAIAALQTDLRRLLGWSLVCDAGLVVLAIVPEGPDVNDAARTVLLITAVARSSLVAWVMVTGPAVPGLRGWVQRLPPAESVLLLVGLIVGAAATYGLPGWPAFEARLALVEAAVPEPFRPLGMIAAWLGLLALVRIVVEGFRARRPGEDRPGAAPGTALDAGATAGAAAGAAAGAGAARATVRTAAAAITVLLLCVMAFALASGIIPVDVRAGDAFRVLDVTPSGPAGTEAPPAP